MNKPCTPIRWYDDENKKFYVHLKEQVWVKTQEELWKICCTCYKFIWCQAYLILNTLLANNNASQTR